MQNKKLPTAFFKSDALIVAPQLLGKTLVRRFENGTEIRSIITEVEAYGGIEDLACHASKGRTPRTEIMFHDGGLVYMYLIYGLYWMLNIVTGNEGNPQAVLIRSTDQVEGPGRLSKLLKLDKSFYGEKLDTSNRLWIEEGITVDVQNITTTPRIGVDYAGEWKHKLWRFAYQYPKT